MGKQTALATTADGSGKVSIQLLPGAKGWRLPPMNKKMVFRGKTATQLAAMSHKEFVSKVKERIDKCAAMP